MSEEKQRTVSGEEEWFPIDINKIYYQRSRAKNAFEVLIEEISKNLIKFKRETGNFAGIYKNKMFRQNTRQNFFNDLYKLERNEKGKYMSYPTINKLCKFFNIGIDIETIKEEIYRRYDYCIQNGYSHYSMAKFYKTQARTAMKTFKSVKEREIKSLNTLNKLCDTYQINRSWFVKKQKEVKSETI